MAQRKPITRQAKMLATRYGLAGGRAAVVGALLLAAVMAAGALANTGPNVTVERADTGKQAQSETRAAQDRQDGASSDEAQGKDSQDKERAESRDKPDVAHMELVVHVDGAVAAPGVYVVEGELPRINDAVALAGGLLPDADTTSLNLAQPLVDGQKVHVPVEGEPETASDTSGGTPQDAGTNAQGEAYGTKVNLNSATADELQRLPGVGEATAASIVDDRERNGPFLSVEDLMRVSGIGEKKFEKMRDMIDV